MGYLSNVVDTLPTGVDLVVSLPNVVDSFPTVVD